MVDICGRLRCGESEAVGYRRPLCPTAEGESLCNGLAVRPRMALAAIVIDRSSVGFSVWMLEDSGSRRGWVTIAGSWPELCDRAPDSSAFSVTRTHATRPASTMPPVLSTITSVQAAKVLTYYTRAIVEASSRKSQESPLTELDPWRRTELPHLIRSRDPPHMTRDELRRLMDCKLSVSLCKQ